MADNVKRLHSRVPNSAWRGRSRGIIAVQWVSVSRLHSTAAELQTFVQSMEQQTFAILQHVSFSDEDSSTTKSDGSRNH
ncbi:hypothetical protein [Bifidobacterium gallicum]|uniref:Uncharacterized protein n=1 Tax=Bifidobacterium gallicum DSM 20093 = LMG 11596 TaxID=561180 RepID=D1NX12_9BIFI|nr:hypothetical protein [Bifidobacterium gallicum]EFA22072.1 hypothetical protein BIFGAL_04420 [Bifidobacterium gallicum DSM 20093 = LMG 11596]